MKPVAFKEQNTVFAKDQSEYQPLPAYKANTPQGEVVSCWSLSFCERLTVLLTGRIWLALLSFNKPLTPSFLTVTKYEVLPKPDPISNVFIEIE